MDTPYSSKASATLSNSLLSSSSSSWLRRVGSGPSKPRAWHKPPRKPSGPPASGACERPDCPSGRGASGSTRLSPKTWPPASRAKGPHRRGGPPALVDVLLVGHHVEQEIPRGAHPDLALEGKEQPLEGRPDRGVDRVRPPRQPPRDALSRIPSMATYSFPGSPSMTRISEKIYLSTIYPSKIIGMDRQRRISSRRTSPPCSGSDFSSPLMY